MSVLRKWLLGGDCGFLEEIEAMPRLENNHCRFPTMVMYMVGNNHPYSKHSVNLGLWQSRGNINDQSPFKLVIVHHGLADESGAHAR